MRIGIGALVGSTGGPRTYAYHLIDQLTRLDSEHELLVFTDHADLFAGMKELQIISVPLRNRSLVPWWDYVAIPTALRRHRVDLYHNTRAAIPWRCPCRAMMTIHDLSQFVYPETFATGQRMYMQWSAKGGARRAEMILTVSQYSGSDIVKLLRVPSERIRVVYNGITDDFHPIHDATGLRQFRQRYRISSPIMLSLGTLQPRKNVDVIIRAFARLKYERRIPHRLYIVGRKGWLTEGLEELAAQTGVQDHVVFTGAVPDEDVPFFYNIADVFISPSSYEGFGLNLLEAMACGVPVITSSVSSIPEVVGDAALMVTPTDADEIADAAGRLLDDQELRTRCIERGLERVARFHWRISAREILKLYDEISTMS